MDIKTPVVIKKRGISILKRLFTNLAAVKNQVDETTLDEKFDEKNFARQNSNENCNSP